MSKRWSPRPSSPTQRAVRSACVRGTLPVLLGCLVAAAASPAWSAKCRDTDGVYLGSYGYQIQTRGPDASNIPTGDPDYFYTPEGIELWAQRILEQPKAVKALFRDEFRQVRRTNTGRRVYQERLAAPAMVAQLAGWRMNDPKSQRAKAAYRASRSMVMDIYDRADAIDDGIYMDRMVATTANLHGLVSRRRDIGTAYVKADWMAFLGDRLRLAREQKKPAIASLTAKHINWLLFACESGTVLQYMAPRAKRETHTGSVKVALDEILAAPMIHQSPGAEAALAKALARLSVQVGKSAKRAMEKDKSKDSRYAYNKAWTLGVVLAHIDVALWKHVRAARKDEASIEHGAKIVRYSLAAIDYLTGGASKAGTDRVRQGVDWLEKNEKEAERAAETASYTKVRSKLVETAVLAFEAELGDLDAEMVNDPDLLDWLRQFRENVLAGHEGTLKQKFAGVKLPGTLNLESF